MWNFCPSLPRGSKPSQIHAKSSLGGMDWLIQQWADWRCWSYTHGPSSNVPLLENSRVGGGSRRKGRNRDKKREMRKEERGNSGRKRQARSWAEMHGDSDHLEEEHVVTASFLVTCRQVEGGNRMLEVRDPLFHCRGETLRPWEVLEASTPGVPKPGCEEHQGPLVIS